MIGRLHHVVLDCPDPRVLAEFYAALLGQTVTCDGGDWVVVAENDHSSGLAFQQALNHVRPTWPAADIGQQIHLDVMVDDPRTAGPEVLALGATHLTADVYSDPAGHPFCLISRPSWAPLIT